MVIAIKGDEMNKDNKTEYVRRKTPVYQEKEMDEINVAIERALNDPEYRIIFKNEWLAEKEWYSFIDLFKRDVAKQIL